MLEQDNSAWAELKRELLLGISRTADGHYSFEYHPFTVVDKYRPLIEEEIRGQRKNCKCHSK